jgi:hypothetical protein
MYIRITFGRDRGYVKDFPVPEAKEMLKLGQALPVNFDEPDALEFRHLEAPETELHLVRGQPAEEQPSAVSSQPSAEAVPPAPVPPPHREGKKKR